MLPRPSFNHAQVFGRYTALELFASPEIKAVGAPDDSRRLDFGRGHHVSPNAGLVSYRDFVLHYVRTNQVHC